MLEMSKESATNIAVEFVKKEKNAGNIEVADVERSGDIWIVIGTFPIDMQGHPWAERFSVSVDSKGKVKASHFSLL